MEFPKVKLVVLECIKKTNAKEGFEIEPNRFSLSIQP